MAPDWTALPFPALEAVVEELAPSDVYYLCLTRRVPFFTVQVGGRPLATHMLRLSMQRAFARELASDAALRRAVDAALGQRIARVAGSTVLRALTSGRWAAGDVDLLCESQCAPRARELITQNLGCPAQRCSARTGPYSRLRNVEDVYVWERTGRRKVDLVVARADSSLARLLESFDIVACRCTWDGRRARVVDPHRSLAGRSAYNPAHAAFLRHVSQWTISVPSGRSWDSPDYLCLATRAWPRAIDLLSHAGITLESGHYAFQWARKLLDRVRKHRERGLVIELEDVQLVEP